MYYACLLGLLNFNAVKSSYCEVNYPFEWLLKLRLILGGGTVVWCNTVRFRSVAVISSFTTLLRWMLFSIFSLVAEYSSRPCLLRFLILRSVNINYYRNPQPPLLVYQLPLYPSTRSLVLSCFITSLRLASVDFISFSPISVGLFKLIFRPIHGLLDVFFGHLSPKDCISFNPFML